MTGRHDVPLWWLLVLRLRINLLLWRLLATKAALRAVRRVCDRIASAG